MVHYNSQPINLLQQQYPECGNKKFVTDFNAGEIACPHCGLVLQGELLEEGPEWNALTSYKESLDLKFLFTHSVC